MHLSLLFSFCNGCLGDGPCFNSGRVVLVVLVLVTMSPVDGWLPVVEDLKGIYCMCLSITVDTTRSLDLDTYLFPLLCALNVDTQKIWDLADWPVAAAPFLLLPPFACVLPGKALTRRQNEPLHADVLGRLRGFRRHTPIVFVSVTRRSHVHVESKATTDLASVTE